MNVNEHDALVAGGESSHPIYEEVPCSCGLNLVFDTTRETLKCRCGALLSAENGTRLGATVSTRNYHAKKSTP